MKYKVVTNVQDWDVFKKQFEKITLVDEAGNQTIVQNSEAEILQVSQKLHIEFWELKHAFNMSFPEFVHSNPK